MVKKKSEVCICLQVCLFISMIMYLFACLCREGCLFVCIYVFCMCFCMFIYLIFCMSICQFLSEKIKIEGDGNEY